MQSMFEARLCYGSAIKNPTILKKFNTMESKIVALEIMNIREIQDSISSSEVIGKLFKPRNNDLYQQFIKQTERSSVQFGELLRAIVNKMIHIIREINSSKSKNKIFDLVGRLSTIKLDPKIKELYFDCIQMQHSRNISLLYQLIQCVISHVDALFMIEQEQQEQQDDVREDGEEKTLDNALKYVAGWCFVSIDCESKKHVERNQDANTENISICRKSIELIQQILGNSSGDDALMILLNRGGLSFVKDEFHPFVERVHKEVNKNCKIGENTKVGEDEVVGDISILELFKKTLIKCNIVVEDNVMRYVKDEFCKKLYHVWMKELFQNYQNEQDRIKNNSHENEMRRDILKRYRGTRGDI